MSLICQPNPETTVACHGGGVANGKGMGYKVSDFKTVQGCNLCNWFTDGYADATSNEKSAVFEAGHARQILEWQSISADTKAKPKDRRAAQWALDRWAA